MKFPGYGSSLLGVLALGLKNSRHLLTLSLSTEARADALLQELETTLVLGDLQQFHGSTFVGSKSVSNNQDLKAKYLIVY